MELFYSLYRHAVSFFVTEDKKIHAWAKLFDLDTCYTVIDALNSFTQLTGKSQDVSKPLPIKYLPLSNLKLEDPFFNDLKKDYGYKKFEEWFKEKAQEGRKAYVYLNKDDSLGAFLMLKEETNELIKSKPNEIFKKTLEFLCSRPNLRITSKQLSFSSNSTDKS